MNMKPGLAGLVISLAAAGMLSGCRTEARQNVPAPPQSICAFEMQRYEVLSPQEIRNDVRIGNNYLEIEVVARYREVVPVGQERELLGWNLYAAYSGGRIDSIGYRTLQELASDFKENTLRRLESERGRNFNGAILHIYHGGFDEEKKCLLANGLGIPYIAWGRIESLKML